MSSFLDTMLARAKADKQTIVLPEGDDPRTLEAAETILAQGVANLIILGNVAAIKESGRALDGATLIDPQDSDLHDEFANTLYELRKHKGMTLEQAAEKVRDVLFFGVLMVKTGRADGMVSGACHSTGDVLRPSLQILKTAPGVKLVSSFFIMVVPNCEYGQNGTFLFSDCGLEIQPDAEKLAHIAVNSAQSWKPLSAPSLWWPCSPTPPTDPPKTTTRTRWWKLPPSPTSWHPSWRSTASCRPMPPWCLPWALRKPPTARLPARRTA